MTCQIYASAFAAALLTGSIGAALARAVPGATSGGAGVGIASVTPSVAVPNANVSFFTDPLIVGPSQISPTGPIGSDPLESDRSNYHLAMAVLRRRVRAPPAAMHAAFRIASPETFNRRVMKLRRPSNRPFNLR